MVSNRLLYFYCEPGDDVKDFQDGVNAVSEVTGQASAFDPLVVDGIFGSNSLKRAREFQRINGLVVDGLVGNGTWGKLLELLHGKGGVIPADRPGGGAGGGQTKIGEKQVFGKPIPSKPYGKPVPAKTSGTQGYKSSDNLKSDSLKSDGYDPYGQKTAPGSQKVSSWGKY
jgi:hypothetical protein